MQLCVKCQAREGFDKKNCVYKVKHDKAEIKSLQCWIDESD